MSLFSSGVGLLYRSILPCAFTGIPECLDIKNAIDCACLRSYIWKILTAFRYCKEKAHASLPLASKKRNSRNTCVIKLWKQLYLNNNNMTNKFSLYIQSENISSLFAHGWVTSMSLVASRMARITHSILINLFIKVGLNIFSPTSPAKYCFCLKNFSASVLLVLWGY